MDNIRFNDDVNYYGGLNVSENESLDDLLNKYNESKGLSNFELLSIETSSNNSPSKFSKIKRFINKVFNR